MKDIKFVDVGEGITEGHLQKFLVKNGEEVKEDAPLFQIETDKAVVNIPSPITGKVKFIAKEDSIVHVGDIIAYIGTDAELQNIGSAAPAPQMAASESQKPKEAQQQATAPAAPTVQQPAQAPASSQKPKEIIATPAVRKLARDLNIDITTVTGTGPQGRILENDIRGLGQQKEAQSKPVPKFSEVLEQQHSGEVERVPMSMTRKAIARNMESSWTIPRATSMEIIDASLLFETVQRLKPKVQNNFGTKLTFLPFIIKAVVEALKEQPRFNASYDRDKQEIVVKKYYNVGLAAEAPDGLKVAVIKNADKKGIMDIAKEIQELGEKVRAQTITIDEMRDSTFTITNIGSLGGGFEAVPMINYPEVAILGIMQIRDWAVVKEGKVVPGKIMPISLVFDHRVVDGAEAVKFCNVLRDYLEDPDFLEMLG